MNRTVKIYIVTHNNFQIPSNPLFVPIQVGTALADKRLNNVIYDNTGDNISCKNKSYCELTAHYWAWKNDNADYYGFFHYRRYLSFKKSNGKPYFYLNEPCEKTMKQLGFDNGKLSELISTYDIVAPMPEDMGESVYNYYKRYHRINDMDIATDILNELFPEYKEASDKHLQNNKVYFGNIFIMKRDIFFDYCSWLFAILEEYEKRSDKSGYSEQEKRAEGFLAERLFGVYYTHLSEKKGIKTLELPRVDFLIGKRTAKRSSLFYFIFPPESRRRYLLKKLFGRI